MQLGDNRRPHSPQLEDQRFDEFIAIETTEYA